MARKCSLQRSFVLFGNQHKWFGSIGFYLNICQVDFSNLDGITLLRLRSIGSTKNGCTLLLTLPTQVRHRLHNNHHEWEKSTPEPTKRGVLHWVMLPSLVADSKYVKTIQMCNGIRRLILWCTTDTHGYYPRRELKLVANEKRNEAKIAGTSVALKQSPPAIDKGKTLLEEGKKIIIGRWKSIDRRVRMWLELN